VIVLDRRESRRDQICRVISGSALCPHALADSQRVGLPEPVTGRCLTVVGLDDAPSARVADLETVEHLKAQGFTVFAVGDGADAWPLADRCRVLLAGASALLDSARDDFAAALEARLGAAARVEAARLEDDERTRNVMHGLGLVGHSRAMMQVFRWLLRVSPLSDLPVLITGETGTGKELVARAIHQLDEKRRLGPFIGVNCAAINAGVAESELFGHRQGAFTGAASARRGLIRSAHGGVLFLDEIGELDERLQAMLLRVLQERRILGVGEDREVGVDVRVIAATNRILGDMLERREFRGDLYHRLAVLAVRIPPLRERSEDIMPLIEHVLRTAAPSGAAAPPTVTSDVLAALARLPLAGNVRELENIVKASVANRPDPTGRPLTLGDLPLEVWAQVVELEESATGPTTGRPGREATGRDVPPDLGNVLDRNGWSLARSLAYCERLFVETALRAANGNQARTARLLGITPRSIYNKIRKYQLRP